MSAGCFPALQAFTLRGGEGQKQRAGAAGAAGAVFASRLLGVQAADPPERPGRTAGPSRRLPGQRGGPTLTKLAASMMPSSTGWVQSRVNFNTCFFFLPPFAAGFFYSGERRGKREP